ncbi:hypothetical protein R6Q59_000543 [Mikania micrantha]
MARSSAAGGRGRGGGRGGGRGSGRGSSRGSTDSIGRQQSDARHLTSMPSIDESNGDDDGSFVHVDGTRRGPASQDKKFGHETLFRDMWMQSRCRKGSRPLDKVSECNSPVVNVFDEETDEGIDSEENVQEQNLNWVDERSSETWKIYEGYLVEKYGDDESKHPEYDSDLWFRATGGKNKGKLYGFSNVSDPQALLTGTPSTSCSSTTVAPSKNDSEIQRLNGVINELVKEKEATAERMASIEALLKVVSQNIQPSS